MILTAAEYCKAYLFANKRVSVKTAIRRAIKGQLPSNHHARKIPGGKGIWIFEISESAKN